MIQPAGGAEPISLVSADSNVAKNAPIKGGVSEYRGVEVQADKAPELFAGFRFKMERQPTDNSILISVKIPGDAENFFEQFVNICRSSALQLQKNLAGLDKWIDNGCKNLDRAAYRPCLFTNPVVSSAIKYCSHFAVTASPDGRVKTVAQHSDRVFPLEQ